MGFGYLFIGYLITFVLYLSVQALGLGGLALLLGYATMMLGLHELTKYQREFSLAKWLCIPLMVMAVYRALVDFSTLLLWDVAFLKSPISTGVDWGQFVLMIFFQFVMLYAIRVIAGEVGLGNLSTKALRNGVFVGFYAILYLLTNLVYAQNAETRKYFVFSLMLAQAVSIFFNLLLLLGCTKNICAQDQDDTPKRSRFEFLNKINDAYDRNQQKSIDRAKETGAAFAEKRRQKREERKNRKK